MKRSFFLKKINELLFWREKVYYLLRTDFLLSYSLV